MVLADILEKVTGQSYETLLCERIFAPIGMNDSGYDSKQPLLSKRAAGYDKRFEESYVNTAYLDMTHPYAAGALYSTVEDLYRWNQALLTEKILSAKSKERLFTPNLSDYGYGWTITNRNGVTGVTTMAHGGSINGFNTLVTRNPDSKRVIVLLNNTGAAPLEPVADSIRMILAGNEPAMPKSPAGYDSFQEVCSVGPRRRPRAGEGHAGWFRIRGWERRAVAARQPVADDRKDRCAGARQETRRRLAQSAGAAVLLARAHRASGHRIEAVQNYSRAIELSDTPRAFLIYTNAIREISALEPTAEK